MGAFGKMFTSWQDLLLLLLPVFTSGLPTSPKEMFQLADMWLTEEQVPSALRATFGLPEVTTDEINFETAGKRDERYRWPERTLSYDLSQVVDPEDKTLIKSTLNKLEKKFDSCVRFREATLGYRVVVVDNEECASSVGFLNFSDNQELSLGHDCMTSSIIEHEFMHAIGVEHTHCRHDRDKYVTIINETIQANATGNFAKLKKDEYDTFELPYDYLSVMHYDDYAYSNGTGRTILTKDSSMQDVIGRAPGVSDGDIELVKRMYKCNEPAPTSSQSPSPSSPRPTPTPGTKIIVEGDYVQTLPEASNDWHYVKITAQPGSDKVFLWRNKAGVEWELVLIDEKKTEDGVPMLVFKVGEDCLYLQNGYTQARLFVKGDKIEIEGPHGLYTKKN